MATEFTITIEIDRQYGKLLGGNLYAGWPVIDDIKIKIGNHMYLEHYIYMYITDDLNYMVCFHNDCIPAFRITDILFRTKIEVDSNDDALAYIFGIQYVTENAKKIFVLGGLNIEVNGTTEQAIKKFVKDYRSLLIDFQKAADNVMQNSKEIINPLNKKTGYYK